VLVSDKRSCTMGFLLSEDRRALVFATRQEVLVHRVHLE